VRPERILYSQVMKVRGQEIWRVKVLWDEDTHEKTWRIKDHVR